MKDVLPDAFVRPAHEPIVERLARPVDRWGIALDDFHPLGFHCSRDFTSLLIEVPVSCDDQRFKALLDGANQFCEAVGLRKGLVLDIYRAHSDWAFIIQTDALLETAVKDVVGGMICLEVGGSRTSSEGMGEFVRSLPVNGKSSLTKLLRASGCDKDICAFIEAVRRLRNAFAHDIRQVDSKLLDVLEHLQDGSSLLRALCPIERWDEAVVKEHIRGADGKFLRFCILDHTLVFLTLGYHVSIKRRAEPG